MSCLKCGNMRDEGECDCRSNEAYEWGHKEGVREGLKKAVEIAEGIEKKDTYPYGAIISEALTREMEGR